MIALDTNVLVHAHRADSAFHAPAAAAVRSLAEGRPRWGLPWPCVHEFLAIVTHARIYAPPTPVEAAVDQVDAWLESPSAVLLAEPDEHWVALRELLLAGRIIGSRVHDAHVAALCLAHGVQELWTVDRDFGRFPALRTRNPLASPAG